MRQALTLLFMIAFGVSNCLALVCEVDCEVGSSISTSASREPINFPIHKDQSGTQDMGSLGHHHHAASMTSGLSEHFDALGDSCAAHAHETSFSAKASCQFRGLPSPQVSSLKRGYCNPFFDGFGLVVFSALLSLRSPSGFPALRI